MFKDFEQNFGGPDWSGGIPLHIKFGQNRYNAINVRLFNFNFVAHWGPGPVISIAPDAQGIHVVMENCYVAPHPSTISFSKRLRVMWDYIRAKKD